MKSASKLLDTGLNTVQSTLLLKKQVEVEKVQEDLDIKRRQFADRMAACKAKEEELKKKQTRVKYLDLCMTDRNIISHLWAMMGYRKYRI